MTRADTETRGRLLVCTDLDRTLIPNGAEPESPHARERFARLVARPNVALAYVTGRHRELVVDAMSTYALPQPDYVIGDVGTSIHAIASDGRWTTFTRWENAIAPDWNGLTRDDLAAVLAGIGSIELQEADRQKRFKLSYYAPVDVDRTALDAAIAARLESRGVRPRIVQSTDELRRIGLLDVLPARASKLHAIEYLMHELGFDAAATVFSGDSGNDLEVLASAIPAVLVANAADDVRDTAMLRARESGEHENLYLARGGFLGMNGNYAAGILEGIVHFHPDAAGWIESDHGNDGTAA